MKDIPRACEPIKYWLVRQPGEAARVFNCSDQAEAFAAEHTGARVYLVEHTLGDLLDMCYCRPVARKPVLVP